MPRSHRDTSDPVSWARQVNARWPVHAGLGDAATAWMDHLEQADPERLRRCAALAAELTRGPGYGADPKPWFYGALFSLATLEEARRFIAPYHLTGALVPAYAATPDSSEWLAAQGEAVRQLVNRIRAEIDRRIAPPGDQP